MGNVIGGIAISYAHIQLATLWINIVKWTFMQIGNPARYITCNQEAFSVENKLTREFHFVVDNSFWCGYIFCGGCFFLQKMLTLVWWIDKLSSFNVWLIFLVQICLFSRLLSSLFFLSSIPIQWFNSVKAMIVFYNKKQYLFT